SWSAGGQCSGRGAARARVFPLETELDGARGHLARNLREQGPRRGRGVWVAVCSLRRGRSGVRRPGGARSAGGAAGGSGHLKPVKSKRRDDAVHTRGVGVLEVEVKV